MILRNKAKTRWAAGTAKPPRRNGRRVESEVSREHDVYVKTKVDFTPGADAPTELRMGYHNLLLTLKGRNYTCVLLPVIPITTDSSIVDPDKIPTRISALMRHFTSTFNFKWKCFSVWATSSLGLNGDFDMMNCIDYNICAANILLIKKRIKLPFTETIWYLQFVKNTIDTDLAQKLIQGDLRKLDPDT